VIFGAVALAFDQNGLGMMEEPVEDGRGDAAYAVRGIGGTMPRAGLCRIRGSFLSKRALRDAA
jgi:hypothetical protein